MKINELIKKLKAIKNEKGNIEVLISDTGTEAFEDLVDIDVYEYTEDTPNQIWVNLISDTFKEQQGY